MRVVVLASGAFAEPSIRWLAGSTHQIPLLVTQPARGSGRGRQPTPTPARLLADELGIPAVEIENVNTPDFVSTIRETAARVMLVIAFGQKLGPEFLGACPGGAINLHASLLPKYRGAAPINWAIARGETHTGCTVFRIVNRMDAGPILAQDATEIGADENAGALHDRLSLLGVKTVRAALELYECAENPEGTVQNDAEATMAPKLKKSDGVVSFAQDIRTVFNRIRAMTPWPGATGTLITRREKIQLTILAARPVEESHPSIAPGTLDTGFRVATSDRLLELLEVQPAGRRPMTWRDFLNGRNVQVGDRFE